MPAANTTKRDSPASSERRLSHSTSETSTPALATNQRPGSKHHCTRGPRGNAAIAAASAGRSSGSPVPV